jgi:hypothetical protein
MVNVIKWGSYETWLTEDMLKSDGRFLTCANAPKGSDLHFYALAVVGCRWGFADILRTLCGLT